MMTEALEAVGDPGDRLVDVGFGGGRLLRLALERRPGLRVAGLEPSPEMVRRAERRFADEISSGRLDVRAGAIEDIPWADDTFDTLVTLNTPYFWRDEGRAIAEIRRVVRPGGKIAIGLPGELMQRRLGLAEAGHRIVSPDALAAALAAGGLGHVEIAEMQRERRRGAMLILARVPISADHASSG